MFVRMAWGMLCSAICCTSLATAQQAAGKRNFGEDVQFLKAHVDTLVLARPEDGSEGPRVAVVPAYQARVMTSSAVGDDGASFGWINYAHIEAGASTPHINVYGGEERFWLGPEGGQFALFFPPGAEFVFEQWQTPAAIDTAAYELVDRSPSAAAFRHEATLTNYAGTKFSLRIDRRIELLEAGDVAAALGAAATRVACVGYRTTNRVTNAGEAPWQRATGLPSIWILGMYKHGPQTVVALPVREGEAASLGPIVNDDYFGRVPESRLRVADGVVYFRADGQLRSKIGVGPRRARDVCGSFDPVRGVLTIVTYNQPESDVVDYVNSQWALQDQPYAGDVVNAYNDGPPGPGLAPLGPFYELETSSPALPLAPGQTGEHVQQTFHLQGDRAELDAVARRVLGVTLQQIETALPSAE